MKIRQLTVHGSTALILLISAVTGASAAIIQVDFGLSSQTTSATGWNNISGATPRDDPSPLSLSDLVDSGGSATGYSLLYSESGAGQSGIAGTGANYGGPYPGSLSGLPASALRDGLFLQNGNTITITLSGLNPSVNCD